MQTIGAVGLRLGLAVALAACGPRAHIPALPLPVPGSLAPADSFARLAHTMAPLLYLQPDEWFPLSRAVAVVHPTRPVIAYHLLWRDDVHGSWIPFTVPTDQEIVWVGYDPATGTPTDLWTFWHGDILHTPWKDRGRAAIDVQWGKHGSLPHRIVESDLPPTKTLNSFYAFTWIGLPDIWLGLLTRPGPACFCRSYDRYREFWKELPLDAHLTAVVRTENPRDALVAVFGKPYSKKKPWPW